MSRRLLVTGARGLLGGAIVSSALARGWEPVGVGRAAGTLPGGVAVLNAQDDNVRDMARLCDGAVLLFSADAALPAIAQHRLGGGQAVVLAGTSLEFWAGDVLTYTLACPPWAQGDALQTQALLAAMGACWALGLDPNLLTAGLQTAPTA